MALEIYKNDVQFNGSLTHTGVNVVIPKYDKVLTTVNSNSGNWQSNYSSMQSNSANWQSTYSSMQSSSANWESAYSKQSNYLPLSGGRLTGDVFFNQNVTIYGDLSCTGTQTFKNTVFSTTSALSVTNTGGGEALWVGQTGAGDIASFYDVDSNIEILHIGGHNSIYPNVGVKVSNPNKDFTVKGELSASSDIWTSGRIMSGGQELITGVLGGTLQRFDSTNSAVYSNSANWNSVYSNVNSTSANTAAKLDSVYSSVNSTSANWNAAYNSLATTSAKLDSVYNNVNSASANWNSVYSNVNSASASWNSVYSNVNSASANWNSVYSNVNSTSANIAAKLDSVYSNVNSTSANTAAKLDSVYNNVNSASANWNSVYSSVNSTSANWNAAYNSLTNTAAKLDSVYSNVNSSSANWNSVYSNVNSTSSRWESVYSNVNSTSAENATRSYVYNNFLPLTGGTITGNITASNLQANTLRLNTVNITGNTTIATSITADNTFIQITLNGVNKYIRLYDIE